MLLWIVVRTRDGIEFCDEPQQQQPAGGERDGLAGGCAFAASWGRSNQLTGPAGWRHVLEAYRRCEDGDGGRDGDRHSLWPTLLFNQGHCGCWGASPTTGEGLVDARDVSLQPAGIHRNRPKPGSDPRVSAQRLCPNEPGCRHDGCTGASARGKGGSSSSSSSRRNCAGPPPAVPWCVGQHGCSAVYARRGFSGGADLGRFKTSSANNETSAPPPRQRRQHRRRRARGGVDPPNMVDYGIFSSF